MRMLRELPLTLRAAAVCLIHHRYLVWQLTLRDVASRYRGSAMGFLWTLILPVLMLAVYTYIFGVVFRSRWPGLPLQDPLEFALVLFAGLSVHMLFADCLNRAPAIVVGQPNLVKKVVFPLELLSWSVVGAALFHAGISILVLLAFELWLTGGLPWTAVLAPLVLLAMVPALLGLCWFFSSLGVFVRDIGQLMNVAVTVILFTAPIFYPAEAAPEAIRPYLVFNPLTVPVEAFRMVAIYGRLPDWPVLGLYVAIGLVIATLGHYWFTRTRRAFADIM